MIKCWIEAMRLRTLPVSLAGVAMGVAFCVLDGVFELLPALLCAAFAVLAQISSNFANEYYDYRAGLDKAGRVGPRRGVAEGDISPEAMRNATFITLGIACMVGLSLIYWGGWWLLFAGIVIAAGAMAYSAGPYPLSRHGLGEVAVVVFFGIVPVNLTYYVQSGVFDIPVLLASVAVGLMTANLLIVNNYRDREEDESVGKRTLAVIYGGRFVSTLYLLNGLAAIALMSGSLAHVQGIAIGYIVIHLVLWKFLERHKGSALNPLLGMTAMLVFLYSLSFLIYAFCIR
ncbi:MAG: 1,4-dihydroxy-2-naphthoate octaprenyltransferase [Bacteroides sp.]|nr:1,4-dihydroxy-2-naphthoate octaprenyltransferase [Bacteroides sp.]MCM1388846.1 1,4-dihydroxy-2-naphthoate octaprenyltransferase [Bacteroides sp.]